MYCTWHSKRNISLTCILGFSVALPLGWVSLFAWHVLFVWVGNTEMSCLELVPARKKLWCQVFTITAGGNFVGFSLRFEGNNVFLYRSHQGFDITRGFKRRHHIHVFTQSSFDADCVLLWNFFSKLVLKSFKTRHHLFNFFQPWKTFLLANMILRSVACRLQLAS